MSRLEELLRGDRLFIAAHRGFSGIYPENTLLAAFEALRLGVDLIEVDLYLSKDNIPVLAHDHRLSRCSNGSGVICDYTLSELKRLDFGAHKGRAFEGLTLPALDEFLDLMDAYPQVLMTMDFKVYPRTMDTVLRVMPLLEKRGVMDRCLFNCIDCDVVAYLCDRYGKRTVGAPHFYPQIRNFKEGKDGTLSKLWGVCVPQKDLTREVAGFYREEGIALVCTPADTREEVENSLVCGVALPLCNDPREYQRIARARGLWQPAYEA